MIDHRSQVGALPLRRQPGGGLELLLVTSRETHRWVIPKGWPWSGMPNQEAAGAEAMEEAGVIGDMEPSPAGTFVYSKWTGDEAVDLTVSVFVMWVRSELPDWPEREQRERAWFSLAEAASLVEEPQLQSIIRALDRPPQQET